MAGEYSLQDVLTGKQGLVAYAEKIAEDQAQKNPLPNIKILINMKSLSIFDIRIRERFSTGHMLIAIFSYSTIFC